MLSEYVSAMGKQLQVAERHNVDVHMLSAGPTPPDPAQRRLPPNPAKPTAGAGELEPSASAGDVETLVMYSEHVMMNSTKVKML